MSFREALEEIAGTEQDSKFMESHLGLTSKRVKMLALLDKETSPIVNKHAHRVNEAVEGHPELLESIKGVTLTLSPLVAKLHLIESDKEFIELCVATAETRERDRRAILSKYMDISDFEEKEIKYLKAMQSVDPVLASELDYAGRLQGE